MGKLEKDPDMKVLYEKGKRKQRHQEAGREMNGEPSVDALRRWFIWAGAALLICLVVVLMGAFVASGKNKKEAAVLELDAGPVVELVLNRKGTILHAKGRNEAGSGLLAGVDFEQVDLDQGLDLIIGGLHESGAMTENEALLLTVRPYEEDNGINVSRMADQAVLYMEKALKKRQTEAVIYYDTLQETPDLEKLADQYQISLGKAGLIKGLVDKNTKLKLEDQGRFAQMEVQEIAEEIDHNKYSVSYESVAVKISYKEKEKKKQETKESTEAESTEASTESAEENTEASESSGENTGSSKAEEPAATKAPETTSAAPETAAPETTAPETAESETAAPETTAPETAAPETAAPETTAPGPAAPETAAPEVQPPAEPTIPEPQTEAPTPVPPVPETVNPAGPGFNTGAEETVPEVKSPLLGPGA